MSLNRNRSDRQAKFMLFKNNQLVIVPKEIIIFKIKTKKKSNKLLRKKTKRKMEITELNSMIQFLILGKKEEIIINKIQRKIEIIMTMMINKVQIANYQKNKNSRSEVIILDPLSLKKSP